MAAAVVALSSRGEEGRATGSGPYMGAGGLQVSASGTPAIRFPECPVAHPQGLEDIIFQDSLRPSFGAADSPTPPQSKQEGPCVPEAWTLPSGPGRVGLGCGSRLVASIRNTSQVAVSGNSRSESALRTAVSWRVGPGLSQRPEGPMPAPGLVDMVPVGGRPSSTRGPPCPTPGRAPV